VRGDSALQGPDGRGDFDRVAGREPPPDFAAQVQGEFRRLLDLLGDAELEQVALGKLEGDGNAEIADRLGVVKRTVDRRLEVIRKLWGAEEGGA
jgi:DNA-directed RNA polymerase specialized sigma24 family protein